MLTLFKDRPVLSSYSIGLLVLIMIFFTSGLLSGVNDARGDEAPTLSQFTTSLLDANAVTASTPSRSQSTNLVVIQAKERLRAILLRIDSHPEEVARVAFSTKVRATFNSEAQKFVEEEVPAIKGVLEVLCAFGTSATPNKTRYYLRRTDGSRLLLHILGPTNSLPQTGTEIGITNGILYPTLTAGEAHLIVLGGGDTNGIAVEGVTPANPTTGVFKTLALLVNFQDQPTSQPWTVDAVKATLGDVSGYDYEASYHHTSLTADVAGWYTVPYKSTDSCDSDTNGIVTSAKSQATAAGINLAIYDRLLFIFPKMSNCRWVGLGYIGGGKAWGIAWINGTLTRQVIAHEMGHNFGLYHAHSLTCTNGAVIGTIGTNCSSSDYGDPADTMGNRSATHFNAAQKESLGWLDNVGFPSIKTVQTSGTYTLEPYESLSTNVKAIRIPMTSPVTATSQYYYLEYRQPLGYDATGLGGNLTHGMLVHQEMAGGTGNSSYILNMTPSDTSFNNAALTSTVYSDVNAPNGGVALSLVSADVNGATVNVTFNTGTPTCVHANPTLSVTTIGMPWVNAGGRATFTLSLKNNDNANCASSVFDFMDTPPTGVTATLGGSTLTLAPGATATMTIVVQSGLNSLNGTYNVPVTVNNNGDTAFSGTTTVSMGVLAPVKIAVAISSDKKTYLRGTLPYYANLTVKTTLAGKAQPNVPLVATLTWPDGHSESISGSTNTVGARWFGQDIQTNSAVGTYLFLVKATYSGVTASQSLSFVVQ
jgi:M6 family metalloprotease-like protein